MSDRLEELSAAGVSIWLDDLSRERLNSGNLVQLRDEKSVVGVTTNPTIFAAALAKGEAYDEQIRELASSGASVHDAIRALTTDDVRNACDVFADTFTASRGVNGRVSIEVSPGLANDTDGTIAEAADLWRTVDRPNAMIKIPATESGLTAITATVADGISVNVTLIFALDRYARVINAYMDGLELAAANGHDLSGIQSVASFFVSRVDAEVDERLEAIGTDDASALKGKAAIANARLAYALYQRAFSGSGWEALAAQGANKQRPLWASTGVKDPNLADTVYVTELVVADTVNTMPEKTLDAFADHGEVHGDQVAGTEAEARQVLEAIAALGISYDDVVERLEGEGLDKFEKSWRELVETVEAALSGDDKEEAREQAGRSDPDPSPAGVSVSSDPAAFVTG